jgi:hypothetical protein
MRSYGESATGVGRVLLYVSSPVEEPIEISWLSIQIQVLFVIPKIDQTRKQLLGTEVFIVHW